MASLNKVFLLGNLTRDPDLRALPSGSSVCEFGIAVNRRYTAANGQEVDEPCFVDIVVWGRAAENCKQYLEKGSQVMVEGRLQFDQWEDRTSGAKRSRLRVVAEQVQFMNRRPSGDGQGGYGDNQGYGDSYGDQPQGGGYNNQQPPRQGGAYGGGQQGGYNNQQPRQNPPQGGMPRAQQNPPQQQGGGVPRAPQQQPAMPPMPDNAFYPDDGAEDDIPF